MMERTPMPAVQVCSCSFPEAKQLTPCTHLPRQPSYCCRSSRASPTVHSEAQLLHAALQLVVHLRLEQHLARLRQRVEGVAARLGRRVGAQPHLFKHAAQLHEGSLGYVARQQVARQRLRAGGAAEAERGRRLCRGEAGGVEEERVGVGGGEGGGDERLGGNQRARGQREAAEARGLGEAEAVRPRGRGGAQDLAGERLKEWHLAQQRGRDRRPRRRPLEHGRLLPRQLRARRGVRLRRGDHIAQQRRRLLDARRQLLHRLLRRHAAPRRPRRERLPQRSRAVLPQQPPAEREDAALLSPRLRVRLVELD
mmetsp:Transcript_7287/g.17622  ORF Transcript_7287/g.17622 Transcript_7287/m.17622 type:complete len:310 (-) Transcript_7287:278-1207(-)